jgi:rubrerythrin
LRENFEVKERILDYYHCDDCGYTFTEDESDYGECPLCGGNNTSFEELEESEIKARETLLKTA